MFLAIYLEASPHAVHLRADRVEAAGMGRGEDSNASLWRSIDEKRDVVLLALLVQPLCR